MNSRLQEFPTMPDNEHEWITLRSGEIAAEIDPLGAQLSALRDAAGNDLLWSGDPAVWNGRAPLLFPIVGMLARGRYRLGTQEYSLSRHGFARGKHFEVVESKGASAAFRLAADASTLPLYPFRFELDARFSIDGPALSITAVVRNLGDGDMPASFGYHPALRWPLPYGQTRESHVIEFDTDEPDPIRRLDRDGLLAPEPHPTPIAGRRLALADALFVDDVVIFDRIRSRAVTYRSATGPRIRLSFPDTPYLGVWTKPGAPFICIEPWHGFSDPAGYSGDFTRKPGVFIVPAGSAKSMTMTLTLEMSPR
jgi:galactose mutarotase-like enzyme